MILFTLSLYFFFLIRSLFVCLLVKFALLVVTLLIENFREKNLVFYCSPSQIFPRKIFLFLFPFSSIEEKHFCEQLHPFIVFSVFEKKNLKNNFRIFCEKNSHPFFITFCFCSSRFAFTSVFHFRFFLIFGFFLISFFLNSFFIYFTFFSFLWTTISPSCCIKKVFKNFLLTCMGYLFMSSLCSSICSSIVPSRFYHLCFPFPSFVFSVHNLFPKQVCGTSEGSSFFSFFFHSLPFNPSIFCEQRDLLFVLSRFYFPKKSSFFVFSFKKISLMKNILFFLSSSVSCILFPSLFVFVHHVSNSPLFSVSVFAWSFVFLISFFFELIFLVLHFQFSWYNNCSFRIYQKKKIKYSLFTCMGYLLMSFLLTDFSKSKKNLFVHFPFCWAPLHIYLFLHVCPFFSIFPSFVLFSCVFTHFSFLFSFLNVFLCWFLFIDLFFWFLCLVWSSFFSPSYSPFFTKKTMCFELFPFVTVSFFTKTVFLPSWSSNESNVPFVFSLSSCFSSKKNLQNKLFLPVFEPSLNHVFFCFIFLDILRNMFPLQKCLLHLFMSSFCSSSFHLFSLFFLSLLVFSFRSPFSPSIHFVGLFIISVFLHVKLCAKKSF